MSDAVDLPKRAYRIALISLGIASLCFGLDIAGVDPHVVGEVAAEVIWP